MLEYLRDNYSGYIQASLGMTTHEEEEALVKLFEKNNSAKERLILFSCTSGYPVAFEDVSLLEIERIKSEYGNRIYDIGFSGHHLGIAIILLLYFR